MAKRFIDRKHLAILIILIVVAFVLIFEEIISRLLYKPPTVSTEPTQPPCHIDGGMSLQSYDISYDSIDNPTYVKIIIENVGLENLHTFLVQLKVSSRYTNKLYSPVEIYNESYPLKPQQNATLIIKTDSNANGRLQAVRVLERNCGIVVETNVI